MARMLQRHTLTHAKSKMPSQNIAATTNGRVLPSFNWFGGGGGGGQVTGEMEMAAAMGTGIGGGGGGGQVTGEMEMAAMGTGIGGGGGGGSGGGGQVTVGEEIAAAMGAGATVLGWEEVVSEVAIVEVVREVLRVVEATAAGTAEVGAPVAR